MEDLKEKKTKSFFDLCVPEGRDSTSSVGVVDLLKSVSGNRY
jgi:hypothetical protein